MLNIWYKGCEYEINRELINILETLGDGQFGKVHKAVYRLKVVKIGIRNNLLLKYFIKNLSIKVYSHKKNT